MPSGNEQSSRGYGNASDFNLFWNSKFQKLYRFASGRGLSHHDAEQVAQEAIRAFIERARKDDPINNVNAFLMGVVANMVNAHYRRSPTQPKLAPDLQETLSTPDNSNGASVLIDAETNGKVREAVNSLTNPLRQVVQLRFYGAMSYEEISEALGIELGTVKSRLNAANKKLNQQLSHYYFDSPHEQPRKGTTANKRNVGLDEAVSQMEERS